MPCKVTTLRGYTRLIIIK